MWTLFLVAYFTSSRIGDLVSDYAGRVSPKVLFWRDITFTDTGATIFLQSPKSSINNKGHSLFLIRNPETGFCPVSFLTNLASNSPLGPVFRLMSGKLVTISLVNKILKITSQLAGVPEGAGFSAHSFRAAMPTAIALNQATFSSAEV